MCKKCILVIDDEESVRLNLAFFFEDEGYDVISAESGEMALEMLKKAQPEVAIVDMRLPGMDGNEVIKSIHRKYPDIKFIVHTGSTNYSLPDDVRNLGISSSHVFRKPVLNMADMVQTVESLFLQSKGEAIEQQSAYYHTDN